MLAGLGCLSVLAGAMLGWQSPLMVGGSTPAAASMRTPSPPAVSTGTTDTGSTEAVAPVSVNSEGRARQARTVTILGVGDILVHREIIAQALEDGGGTVDFRPQLEGIRALVESADLAVCHVELPMGSREGPWSAWPEPPNAPPHLADAVAELGFDTCSTASNHTLDQGMDGVASTLAALDQAGLAHAGSAANPDDASRPTIIDVNGVPVAHLSYTYSFNGIPAPHDWCCNLIDPARIVADAQRARDAGARIVVTSLHHGVEGVTEPTALQQSVVQALAESGQVDLVIGHHAHVVQPVTRVGTMWVAYGHGNLLSAQSRRDPRSGDGLLTLFTFTEQPDGRFAGTSAVGYAIVNDDFPFRIRPVGDAGTSDERAEATWTRIEEQALISDDTSGFTLRRFG